ncbi:heme oxygenase (biliverdin-producing) [Prochlorococcus sp. MIT 1223]|uniref:biliverdin-producing heme oxygenase n=1 Tax=Prochlorococcus sp. MIT 1223 TaxID=3096217 RepID=UPI002A757993|nr:heme oxygenase (biliverdin-producing) [Prochlorococcus sp. MIT 1223]
MSVDLAIQLREGTKKSHTMAENTGFISCFLKGVVEKNSYRKLLADLYFVYSAMEDQITRLASEGHPIVSNINFKELNRRNALEKDLNFYFGIDWQSSLKMSSSAQVYVDRINQIGQEQPELLIGHHYSRYIGDLSGGKMLKKITQRSLDLSNNDGLNFYIFNGIDDEKAFKDNYRKTLNSLSIDQGMADLIIEEANKAFTYNMNIFQELEGNLIASIGKVLFRYLTKNNRKGSTE